MRAKQLNKQSGDLAGWYIRCPACDGIHVIDTRWTFNGDFDRPTFKPSLLLHPHPNVPVDQPRCHSFITDGRIQYLGDCTHTMAGQTVDLPELE